MKLIVHADDFGLTERVNEGIIRAHVEGILTSTSIMACGKAFEHAVELIKAERTLDVGIHLTLAEEHPVLHPDDIPSLVVENGHFYPHAKHFFMRYIQNKIAIDEVRREFKAQFEKVLDYGVRLTHIDSHQHIHILPKIFELTVEIAKKYRIKIIRTPNEKIQQYMFYRLPSYPRLVQLLIIKTILRFVNHNKEYISPQFFGFFYGGKLDRNNLMRVIDTLPKHGVGEIMCHPGLHDVDSDYTHWEYDWQDELEALTDTNVRTIINKKNISLISYRDW